MARTLMEHGLRGAFSASSAPEGVWFASLETEAPLSVHNITTGSGKDRVSSEPRFTVLAILRYEWRLRSEVAPREGAVRISPPDCHPGAGMEAWPHAHWARENADQALGHKVRLIPNTYVALSSRRTRTTTGFGRGSDLRGGRRWCRKVGGKLENWRKLLIVKHSERRCAAAERSLRHETSYGIDVAQSIFR